MQCEREQSPWSVQAGLYYFKGRLYVASDAVQMALLREAHDSPTAGHSRVQRTVDVLQRQYYWPGICRQVRGYIHDCDLCQRIKASCAKPAGLLQPLPMPSRPWSQVTLDFVTGLPPTKAGHDSLLVFTDKFPRMAHLVSTTETCTAEDTAELFLTHVYKHHGLPQSLVSDRNPCFTSHFWQALHRALGVDLRMSMAFHPQTDGATKRTNQTVEDLLRAHCSVHQRDWEKYLPMVEFAFNNAQNASTGETPFFLNYGFHPETLLSAALPRAEQTPAAQAYLHARFEAQEHARRMVHVAQNRQRQQYDKRHRALEFAVGDFVMLSTKHLDLPAHRCRKLSDRQIGPYKVVQQIGLVAYRLELPPHLRIHPVFHVSLLSPYHGQLSS